MSKAWDCFVTDRTSNGKFLDIRAKYEQPQLDKMKQGESMSLCMAIIYEDKMYIAADSRSSKGAGFVSFGNQHLYSIPVSHSYKKIFRIGDDTAPIIGFSVGDNCFVGENLMDFISSFSVDSTENIAIALCNRMNNNSELSKNNTLFYFFQYQDRKLYCVIVEKEEGNYKYSSFPVQLEEGYARKVAIGASWATLLSDYVFFAIPENSEKETLFSINDVYNKANIVGCYYDNSVGGPIHIGKLTPEGFSWLQNGYIL